MPEQRELSADDIEQAGRLLEPLFEKVVRKELRDSLAPLAARVDTLERFKAKAMVGWSGIVLVVTFGFNWITRKLGLEQ